MISYLFKTTVMVDNGSPYSLGYHINSLYPNNINGFSMFCAKSIVMWDIRKVFDVFKWVELGALMDVLDCIIPKSLLSIEIGVSENTQNRFALDRLK
jgi:hypothetical protein